MLAVQWRRCPPKTVRLTDCGQNLVRHSLRLLQGSFRGFNQRFKQHHKLVPSDPSHGVCQACGRQQTNCGLTQDQIAGGVAKSVVLLLEIV